LFLSEQSKSADPYTDFGMKTWAIVVGGEPMRQRSLLVGTPFRFGASVLQTQFAADKQLLLKTTAPA
jgi:hypothetical protein